MNPVLRIGFGALALAALAGVAYFSFRGDATRTDPVPVASPTEALIPAAQPEAESAPASKPFYKTDAEIPYDKLTTVSKYENRVIYTVSSLGEPMEVHPDGMVVIYNHRKVLRYADGREEVRYVTLRAKPRLHDKPIVLDEDEPPPPAKATFR